MHEEPPGDPNVGLSRAIQRAEDEARAELLLAAAEDWWRTLEWVEHALANGRSAAWGLECKRGQDEGRRRLEAMPDVNPVAGECLGRADRW